MLQHPLFAEEIVRDRVERLRAEADRERVAAVIRRGRRRASRSRATFGWMVTLLRSVIASVATTRVRSPSP